MREDVFGRSAVPAKEDTNPGMFALMVGWLVRTKSRRPGGSTRAVRNVFRGEDGRRYACGFCASSVACL